MVVVMEKEKAAWAERQKSIGKWSKLPTFSAQHHRQSFHSQVTPSFHSIYTIYHLITLSYTPKHEMSFLFGGGRPQPSSAEKIAAVEAEIDMVSDMYNRYYASHIDTLRML